LVGTLCERSGIGDDDQRRALVQLRLHYAGLDSVAAYREQRHTATMDTPLVDNHRLEFARHARLEDAFVHVTRNAHAVVEQGERAPLPFSPGGQEDPLRVRVA